MKVDRRKFLKTTAGVAIGAIISEQSASTPQLSSKDVRAEQGRYLKKHSAQRQLIYDEMVPIFDPPDDADYGEKFAESLIPSASSLLPGIAGSAADLKETLEWYNNIRDSNGFRSVSEQGIKEFGEPTRGRFGVALDEAKEELEELKNTAETVHDDATEYSESPTEDNYTALIESLNEESNRVKNVNWIEDWSNISPSQYNTLFAGDVEEAAEQIRDNASAVSQIVTAAGDIVQTQADMLENEEIFRVPDLIITYEDQVEQIRQNVPESLFSVYAGDSINIHIQNEDREDISVTWIDTDNNGEITEYSLLEQSADADLAIPEDNVEQIRGSENPSTEIKNIWDNDEISLSGNGFMNGIKYNHTGMISDIFDQISNI